MKFDPKEDGITHINVYSMGKTELGQFLSNFYYAPIYTEDEYFASIEGYWYWISTKDDALREMSGIQAKRYGQKIGGKDWIETREFQTKIKLAIVNKIETHGRTEDVVYSELPFTHYYNFGGKIVAPKQGQWIVDFLNELRIQNAK